VADGGLRCSPRALRPAQFQIGHLYRQGHRFVMIQSDEEAAH
jgi:hypothetical protein